MSSSTASHSYIVDKYFSEIERALEKNNAATQNGEVSRSSSRLSLLFSTEHQVNYGGLPSDNNNNGRARRPSSSASSSGLLSGVHDLIHISGPLTEDAIVRVLQARFYSGVHYTHVGPILLALNPCHERSVTRALDQQVPAHLQRTVHSAMTQLQETRCSQSIVLNGVSGSGKSHASLQLLRQLFDVAGGGAETDAFKHLNASLTVLHSLSQAATQANRHASRMGFFIENYISDGAIHKTKIHCITIDQSRISHVPAKEKNYHIFYQVLAGLTPEERVKYHLEGYSARALDFLSCGDGEQNLQQDKARFDVWKACLLVLGIPVHDILRMLSAVMLLGNVHFRQGQSLHLEVHGNKDLGSAAALLGLAPSTLYRALTTRSRSARGQGVVAQLDATAAHANRDALARALYMRTLNAVIKRANSSRRPNHGFSPSNSSTESNGHEMHSPAMGGSSSLKSPGLHSRASSQPLHRTLQASPGDSFIAVLDMMGFELLQHNELEQLCINLTAETLQHFYNTHIFKATEEACIEEGIQCEIDISYHENAPVVELISSQRTGILSLLDAESSVGRGLTDTYMQKVRVQHNMNPLFSDGSNQDARCFTVCHFVDRVTYVTDRFIPTNQDRLSDDVVAMLGKQSCNFGFVTHLFAHELKTLQEQGTGPSGRYFRCFPHSAADYPDSSDALGSLSLDFHTKLDNLLKTLVQTSPHFIRCVKTNEACDADRFQRDCVVRQLRSLQVLETLHLMAAGFPHRYRYKSFNARYRILVRPSLPPTEHAYSHTKLILDSFMRLVDESMQPYASANWALGKKHIFLSESARQQFDSLREEVLRAAATLLQAHARGLLQRKRWPALRTKLGMLQRKQRPPPALPAKPHIRKNGMTSLNNKVLPPLPKDPPNDGRHLHMEPTPPPVPPTRPYTVQGDLRLSFPQYRVMTQDYKDLSGPQVMKGQKLHIVGFAQTRRGYLTASLPTGNMEVPHTLTELWDPNKLKMYADV